MPGGEEPREAARASVLPAFATALAVTAVAAASSWLVLSYQVALRNAVPIGPDTPSHLWRTRIVHALGLRGLFGSSPFEYHANSANPDRIGLPVLGSVFGATVHVGPWRLMFVASALAAAALAFAAWAVARAAGEPRWAAPIYAAVVAVSIPFVITARSHLDNALVDVLIVAVAAVAIRIARGESGVVVAVALTVGAVLMHWPVGAMMLGVLGLYAVALLPLSIAVRRDGVAWWATPSAKVGLVAGLSAGLGAGALAWTPGAHVFETSEREPFAHNVTRLLHYYRLPIQIPLALVGAVMLWLRGSRSPQRRALLLYLAWMVPILGGVALFAAGKALPVMRFVAVALPVPLLAAAAGVGLIRLASRPRGALGYVLAGLVAVVVVAGIAVEAVAARHSFEGTEAMASPTEVQAIRTAIRYLETSAPGRQAVFVVRESGLKGADFGMIPAFRRIRAFAPGAEASRIATYLGYPGDLLMGRATRDPALPGFDPISMRYWHSLQDWLHADPVVMVLAPYHDRYQKLRTAHPGAEIAPGVMLLRGPPPVSGFVPPAALSPPGAGRLIGWTAAAFAMLLLAGIGWTWALLRLPWDERVALAPAVGMAALVLAAFVLGMRGVALSGASGRWVAVGVTAAGWAAGLLRWALASRGTRRPAPQPGPA